MFNVDNGWLSYEPFKKYQLPELVENREDSLIRRHRDGAEGKPVNIYKLRWPGQKRFDTTFPWTIAQNWDTTPTFGNDIDICELLVKQLIPDEPPESLAYHLAVHNYTNGNGGFPIAGLPFNYARKVLDAEFAIGPEYLSAIKYLKWVAENHRHHPLFQGFDTVIRESLMGMSIKAVQLYFRLIFDCLYDKNNKWFSRDNDKYILDSCACYLHWVGRTGMGLYEIEADFPEDLPDDLKNRLSEWNKSAMRQCRENSYIDRK